MERKGFDFTLFGCILKNNKMFEKTREKFVTSFHVKIKKECLFYHHVFHVKKTKLEKISVVCY